MTQVNSTSLPGTKHVDLSMLVIDNGELGYQRELDRARVERIARNFDPALFGAIEVSERADGKLYVVDGQHRIEALRMLGATARVWDIKIPCIVRRHLTREKEAEHFSSFNTQRRHPTAFDLYKADRVAQHEAVVEIDAILTALSLKPVARNDTSPNGVRAVGTVREIHRWHGSEMLHRVLAVATTAWPEDGLHGRGSVILDALTAFIATHAARGHVVDDTALTEACSRQSAKRFAATPAISMPAYKQLASDLAEPYNKTAKRNQRVDFLTPRSYSKRPRRPANPPVNQAEVA